MNEFISINLFKDFGSCVLKASVKRVSVNTLDMSVDTRPTPRSICCDQQSLVYRSTVGDV